MYDAAGFLQAKAEPVWAAERICSTEVDLLHFLNATAFALNDCVRLTLS